MSILTSAVCFKMFFLCDIVQKIIFLLIITRKYLYNLTIELIGFNGTHIPISLGACSLSRNMAETRGVLPKELLDSARTCNKS